MVFVDRIAGETRTGASPGRSAWAKKSLVAAAMWLMLTSGAPVFASATIVDISPRAHGAPAGTTLTEIGAAIARAAHDRNWTITSETPGAFTASIWVRRRHRAIVHIGYDESRYWIEYRDSENLNYSEDDKRRRWPSREVVRGPRIHANYNKWVRNLARSIEIRAMNPRRTVSSWHAGSRENFESDRIYVADELEKLESLRQREVLTRDEFEYLKAKLLAR